MPPIWKTHPRLTELALAVLLSGIYFWCVQDYAFGTKDNITNGRIFTACSVPSYYLPGVEDVWKGRLAGMLLTGGLFDGMLSHLAPSLAAYEFVFGLYQAGWLFLLFLVIILAVRRAWLINLGIFAGVMYDFFPASGLYVYPWDIPATLFFTLAALLFERRQMALMMATVAVGCFYKETVLVCALLVFFATPWPWWRRTLAFAGLAAIYILGKKLLLHQLQVQAAALSMSDAKNTSQLLQTWGLVGNLKTLCSGRGLYDIFANAGTLAAVLLFGWQKRFLPFMLLILAFLAGQLMYGSFLEFRIFMQVLPLSLILLADRWCARPADPDASTPTRLKNLLPAARPLTVTAFLLAALPTMLAAWQYLAIQEGCQLDPKTNIFGTSDATIQKRDTAAAWYLHATDDCHNQWSEAPDAPDEQQYLDEAGDWFQTLYLDDESQQARTLQKLKRYPEALVHFRISTGLTGKTEPDSPEVANDLAWLFATARDPGLRNGREALDLARQACDATHYQEPAMIGTLAAACAETMDFTNAVKYCQQARTLARATGQTNLLDENTQLLKFYKSGRAFHQ